MTAKACFLDRDGTLIEERNYLSDPALVALAPGVPEALRLLRAAGYRLIVISNQSGIARGFFTEDQLKSVERRVGELLAEQGLSLDANYYCFHHEKGILPEYSHPCDCRKPRPGMLLRAMRDFSLDPAQCLMIGDKVSDLQAGYAAGCRLAALVRSGHGADQDLSAFPEAVDAPDILTAVRELLAREAHHG